MPRESNFLLGHGERLTSAVTIKSGQDKPKAEPYSFAEARDFLQPEVARTARDIGGLPSSACPDDRAVASLTVHPTYIAKSYYPRDFLRTMGFEAIGSKQVTVEARRYATSSTPTTTYSIFVSGARTAFARWASTLMQWSDTDRALAQLRVFEHVDAYPASQKVKRIPEGDDIALEVVLHAEVDSGGEQILRSFGEYAEHLGMRADFQRRMHLGGLCFVPVRGASERVPELALFSFLRVVRGMPKLRPLRPAPTRARSAPFVPVLPSAGPLDPSLRVAILDGGLVAAHPFSRWVDARDGSGVGPPVADMQEHGHQVTSALLFGALDRAVPAAQPYAKIDHFRVLDTASLTGSADLYDVLPRVDDILSSRVYEYVNLSLGPDQPAEDEDVSPWTALLDLHASSGRVLITVAAGNDGELDHASGNARVQVPGDAVNIVAVGAADRRGPNWSRAAYSCIGPGRSPGLIKPDGLAFGGSDREPFHVFPASGGTKADGTSGTSFSAPLTLRAAIGVRAHLGPIIQPLAVRALLVHRADTGGHELAHEIGWGRFNVDVAELTTCDDCEAIILYQGELEPGKYLRAPVPVPAAQMEGMVTVSATFCYAAATDPAHPGAYTRDGLGVTFRPHDGKRKEQAQTHANPSAFFGSKGAYTGEDELRRDAMKWETCMRAEHRFRAASLQNPVFDIHYQTRDAGHVSRSTQRLPYALLITVRAPKVADLYNQIVKRYRTQLEPLRPLLRPRVVL